MAQYATAAKLLELYDSRRIGQMVSDSGTVPNAAALLTNQIVASMLAAASDEVLAAAAVGNRYTAADLDTLAAGTDAGARLIQSITCHIAFGLLVNRRGYAADEFSNLVPMWKWAQDYLTLLRKAERIFPGVPDVPEAGLPDTATTVPRPGINPPRITQEAYRVFGWGPVTTPRWWT
jgi:hypothetical protein